MVLTLIALAISYNRPTVARTRPKHVSILLERVAVQQAADAAARRFFVRGAGDADAPRSE
ncbi:hypothetical protein CFB52_001170 [Burkholderia sp. AU18528]|nr:hypothetical protein CFB52_001170 [Burkholderia sp. AU18528]